MQTKGAYRVGTAFNPSGEDAVGKIKAAAAELIDLIESLNASGIESARLKALAQTSIEEGAMWAAKLATKPPADF